VPSSQYGRRKGNKTESAAGLMPRSPTIQLHSEHAGWHVTGCVGPLKVDKEHRGDHEQTWAVTAKYHWHGVPSTSRYPPRPRHTKPQATWAVHVQGGQKSADASTQPSAVDACRARQRRLLPGRRHQPTSRKGRRFGPTTTT